MKQLAILDAVAVLRSMDGESKPLLGRRVAVYGGGNTAMDVARTAKRMGAEDAIVVYRRTRDRMPAHDFEVEEAEQEGVVVKWLSTVKRADAGVLVLERMELDETGFPQPTGELEELAADSLVLALGQEADLSLLDGVGGLEVDDGVVQVDAGLMTGRPGIFAGGDMVPAERTVTVAVGHGKKAARHIDVWLRGEPNATAPKHALAEFGSLNTWYYADAPRSVQPLLELARRRSTFEEVVGGLDESNALFEARRCLSCGNCFSCDNCFGVCPDNAVLKLAGNPDEPYAFDLDLLQGLRHLRRRVPLRCDRDGARDGLAVPRYGSWFARRLRHEGAFSSVRRKPSQDPVFFLLPGRRVRRIILVRQVNLERRAMGRSDKSRVLIAGGGVAALEAALALRELAEGLVDVEFLCPEPHFWYRPLAVAAPFRLGEVRRFELDGLTRALGARFTLGALVGVDPWRRVAHTSNNVEIEYDTLLVACGAVPTPAIPGALTFRGPADTEKIEHLLQEIERDVVRSVAFAIPWGAVWSLPAYELALLTAAHLKAHRIRNVELTVVTPEEEPLQLFGSPAVDAIRELFSERGVALQEGAYAGEFADGELRLIPEGYVPADRVVALPRLRGTPIDGLPQTVHGFVPVDAHCRVAGLDDVFAAGDITSFTVKQGGIAAQQAHAAAEAIAAAAGADVSPQPFRPVLRGLLLTGGESRYLRRELGAQPEREPVAGSDPLWWPPAKIVGRHLAPFLASLADAEAPPELPSSMPGALSIEVELDPQSLARLRSSGLRLDQDPAGESDRVDVAMRGEPLVVAPEDTLGEVAELMLERDTSAAAVAEYGRLIGILTGSDLLRASGARVHPSEARVRQWMTAEPVAVSTGTTLAAAATLMGEYGIHHLPVVEGERPVGMLSRDEVSRYAAAPVGLGF